MVLKKYNFAHLIAGRMPSTMVFVWWRYPAYFGIFPWNGTIQQNVIFNNSIHSEPVLKVFFSWRKQTLVYTFKAKNKNELMENAFNIKETYNIFYSISKCRSNQVKCSNKQALFERMLNSVNVVLFQRKLRLS